MPPNSPHPSRLPKGYALAAKSLTIHSYHIAQDNEKRALFDRATLLAREAIRLDPVNPEAHLELAHAMGRQAQTLGVLKAVNEGYAENVREAIEEALRLDPEMMSAHLSLATWHAEAVNSGGFMASLLYGATEKGALDHYQMALGVCARMRKWCSSNTRSVYCSWTMPGTESRRVSC